MNYNLILFYIFLAPLQGKIYILNKSNTITKEEKWVQKRDVNNELKWFINKIKESLKRNKGNQKNFFLESLSFNVGTSIHVNQLYKRI